MLRKTGLLARDPKQSKSLAFLPDGTLGQAPGNAGQAPDLPRNAALEREISRLVQDAFQAKFERVEQDILQTKRFFIVEQRQTPVYIAFFEGLRDELHRDPSAVIAKSKAALEELAKSAKMPAQNRKRFMEPLERDVAAGMCQTEARNPFLKRQAADRKPELMDGATTPGGPKTPNEKLSLGKSGNGGTTSKKQGFSGTLQIKVTKVPITYSTKDLRLTQPASDRMLKLESSAASRKGLDEAKNREVGYHSHQPGLRKNPSAFELGPAIKPTPFPAPPGDGMRSVQTPKGSQQLAQQLVNEVVEEIDELETANKSQASDAQSRKTSKAGPPPKRSHRPSRSFIFPSAQETPVKTLPPKATPEPQPDTQSQRLPMAAQACVLGPPTFRKKSESFQGDAAVSPTDADAVDAPRFMRMPSGLSHASFESLEAMLLEREASLRHEHFSSTKQQIIDSAAKFLPKDSRTLSLFSRSGAGEAEIFIDSMRHSLLARISELDQQIAASKSGCPNLARDSFRLSFTGPRFEPSQLCLLAFRTVSKKDVIRGMSAELFGGDVARLFSLFSLFLLEPRPLAEVLAKNRMELLNEVSDFYLAQLAAQSLDSVCRCNDLSLPDKIALEEFLDANPGIFRLVSDINLNAYHLSVAFLVFECLAFLGLRRFVVFMEKKKDADALNRTAAAELAYLSQKRDFYLAKVADLSVLEREMHSFNGWAR